MGAAVQGIILLVLIKTLSVLAHFWHSPPIHIITTYRQQQQLWRVFDPTLNLTSTCLFTTQDDARDPYHRLQQWLEFAAENIFLLPPEYHRACHQSANLSTSPSNNEKPLKMKLNIRCLPCSGANVLQIRFCSYCRLRAVARNGKSRKKQSRRQAPKQGGGVFGLSSTGLWGKRNHIWPSQWAGDKTNVSRKMCHA